MVFENCRIHSRLKRIGSFNSISQSNRAVPKSYDVDYVLCALIELSNVQNSFSIFQVTEIGKDCIGLRISPIQFR